MALARRHEWQELALATAARAQRRSGGARRAVIETLAGHDCCVSAQQIADDIRTRGDGAGLASVYRALELLEGEGLVQRLDVGDGTARFEAALPGGEHHHHAICERCGRLTAFEDPGLERAIGRLSKRLGHTVRSHDVLIKGECEGCVRRGR